MYHQVSYVRHEMNENLVMHMMLPKYFLHHIQGFQILRTILRTLLSNCDGEFSTIKKSHYSSHRVVL